MAKQKKSLREQLADDTKTFAKLLLWEASGGIIRLPKGVKRTYKPPTDIGYKERVQTIDTISDFLEADNKIDGDKPTESPFERMKGGLNAGKRTSGESGGGGISSYAKNGIAGNSAPAADGFDAETT